MKIQQRKNSGRHFGTHSIVKFERRSIPVPVAPRGGEAIARKLKRLIANLFPVTAEPRIREIVTATGDGFAASGRRWIVYDANQSYRLEFDSEQAVLEWLDVPRPSKTRFERIWN